MGRAALRILVSGVVQGVGFRPFVYRAALLTGIAGYVRNMGGSEVEIWVEGTWPQLRSFLQLFSKKLPPPADIEELEISEERVKGFNGFRIQGSGSSAEKRSMIPPDFAVCRECLREVLNPRDRRYRYPFNSCAYCGPRFSMMYRVPYDRENTAMRDFPMCEECRREYEDPLNERRFHAQGISCPRCGPRVWLETVDGERVEASDPIREAARLIDEGYIVAVKGLGGFHIAALASDDEVVLRLRRRKRRPTKPFAIMALDKGTAARLVYLDEHAARILESPEAPILLLPRRSDAPVSEHVAPGLAWLGVMLAYTPLHYLLLSETRDKFLIMTSGNIHGKPMCITAECVKSRLRGVVDYVLNHNRVIVNRVDDSVARFTRGRLLLIRRGRGYAPRWVRIGFRLPREVIAFGAELQNAGAVAFEDKVVLTQYIGDTDDYDTLLELDYYLRWFAEQYRVDARSAVLVADMHPGYNSRRLAEEWSREKGASLQLVQHHHAHIAAVMGEYRVKPGARRVGIAVDGTGYGLDGTIWGGEVIVTDIAGFERFGHLKPIPLPGGDRATEWPARIAVGLLTLLYGEDEAVEMTRELGLTERLPHGKSEAVIVARLVARGSAPLASSTGRFLDAISALLGVCHHRGYEGEPAIRLESFSLNGRVLDDIEARVENNVLNTHRLFQDIVEALRDGARREDLAATVEYRLGEGLARIALEALDKAEDSSAVYMGGGAAVNELLVAGAEDVLSRERVPLLLPRRVPPGDGGIALGQAVIAGARLLHGY